MAIALFDRDFSLNIGGKKIATTGAQTLKIAFQVTKTLGKEPNKAEISIENLKEETRALFQTKNQGVVLEAGYRENTSVIFSGAVDHTDIERVSTGWIVRVLCSDGGVNQRRGRINRSFRGEVDLKNAARAVISSMGLGLGNTKDLPDFKFGNGLVVSGRSDQQLEKLARKAGVKYSIQDGQVVFLLDKQTLKNTVPVLSSDSGMVGTPQIGEKGFVTLTAKIQPGLNPGGRFKIESKLITGFYRVEKATYQGDSWGPAWIVNIEGKPV
jgi:hypothetical protein